MPETLLMRRPEVERLLGVRRTTIYKWLAAGIFPEPIRLGPRVVAWRREDIVKWIAEQPRAQRRDSAA